MTVATTSWEPDNPLEADLLEARASTDDAAYLRLLARADLLIPTGGSTSWPTTTAGGRTFVLAFTSERAAALALAESLLCRRFRIAQLARTWPDRHAWLAVDPGLEIQGLLSIDTIELVATYADEPAGELEWALERAGDDTRAYADALLPAELFLPLMGAIRDLGDPGFTWPLTDDDTIPAYTSADRLRDQLGGEQDLVTVAFVELLSSWPDPDVALEINPGSAIGARIEGAAIDPTASSFRRTRS